MRYFSLILIVIFLLFSCNSKTDDSRTYQKYLGFTQGTTYTIIFGSEEKLQLKSDIENLLLEFDSSLSIYNPKSIISKVNRNEFVQLDSLFIKVINTSLRVSKETNGAFDITAGPVINAWGFGFTEKENITQQLIDSLQAFCGYDKINIINGMIEKDDPRISLNVNAIAQGYSVDIVAAFLESKGIQNYMVDIGGEIKTKGVNQDNKIWSIGIDKPIDNNQVKGEYLQVILKISDAAIATSGNYRKFYEVDGIKYSHTIDPLAGYPVSHSLLSASVIADECILADAYATAFMVMGLEKSIEFLKSHPEVMAYLLYADKEGNIKVYYSEKLKKSIEEI